MINREYPHRTKQTIKKINRILYGCIIAAAVVMVFVLLQGMKKFF